MSLARLLGGLLFAVGALALFLREAGDWGDFPLLLVVLVPFALLYGVGMSEPVPTSWRSVFLVVAVLLAPFVLLQFVELIDGNPESGLNVAWVFLLVAGLAGVASFRREAAYQALLMALAAIVAWLAFWSDVLDDPSATTFRWLLVVIGLGFAGAVVRLRGEGRPQGEELVTAAFVAGVAAGAVTLPEAFFFGALFGGEVEEAGVFWNIVLVAVSTGAIAYTASTGRRGPAYAGAVGLAFFLLSEGVGLFTEDVGGLVGWPLVLLLVGGAALAAGFLLPPGRGGEPEEALPVEQT